MGYVLGNTLYIEVSTCVNRERNNAIPWDSVTSKFYYLMFSTQDLFGFGAVRLMTTLTKILRRIKRTRKVKNDNEKKKEIRQCDMNNNV